MRGNQGWTVNSQGLSLWDGSINLPPRIWSFQGKTFTLASFHRNFLLFVLPSSLSMVWAEFRIYTRLFSLRNYSVKKLQELSFIESKPVTNSLFRFVVQTFHLVLRIVFVLRLLKCVKGPYFWCHKKECHKVFDTVKNSLFEK